MHLAITSREKNDAGFPFPDRNMVEMNVSEYSGFTLLHENKQLLQ
jgi:hypothetical protein